ncbi:MAG: hypothetical protein A2383_00125 [Candidatus Pacebacteria bacterium RIFOXYB1_FULL_39_46]|nr:MAG: hypothetical protein A2383_00125 [Candidatus Pacebacteria bacterium RIFOXYB1_FULL_39_46]OGJ38828.1 MAG: hypothetical protein A2182_02525 [Candidatus Pacebacteria bacterium RIFOXYA1_FULL_38_18]OGJ40651.1 MAG: hypothetical protein A2582_03045 [Candidatus Pacebacteria bacterium RIFOXYD1_FULL_39_27]OGJ40821.1 MAG: hypothetical protein A2411_00855 [Candidatus Pacebacteria bacterium RIFOXYC1_FULL_39_21]
MKKIIKFYYLILILVIASQAIYTVYRLSGTVGQGKKLSQLQQQQTIFEEELQILQEKRSTQFSLTKLAETRTADYLTIGKPIILNNTESVASR